MPHRIDVELTYRSGRKQVFEINDEILEGLEELQATEVPMHELCRAWTQSAPWDPPARLRVFGRRADGSDVLMEVNCEEPASGQAPTSQNGTK